MKDWKDLFKSKNAKEEPELQKGAAFRLRRLNKIEIIKSGWGYFQLCEYQWDGVINNTDFTLLFPKLKQTDFFQGSLAYGRGIEEKNAAGYEADTWFGRYQLSTILESDYIPLNYEVFLNRIQLALVEQQKFSFKWTEGFLRANIKELQLEIVPIIEKIINPQTRFFELLVDENKNQEKLSGISLGIWDYFKNFIGLGADPTIVYRIDMGID